MTKKIWFPAFLPWFPAPMKTNMEHHGTSWNIMEHHGTSWNIMEPKNPHLANQRKNRPTSIFEAQSMNMFRVPPVKSHQNPAKNQS
jgi:hypothetical protein